MGGKMFLQLNSNLQQKYKQTSWGSKHNVRFDEIFQEQAPSLPLDQIPVLFHWGRGKG